MSSADNGPVVSKTSILRTLLGVQKQLRVKPTRARLPNPHINTHFGLRRKVNVPELNRLHMASAPEEVAKVRGRIRGELREAVPAVIRMLRRLKGSFADHPRVVGSLKDTNDREHEVRVEADQGLVRLILGHQGVSSTYTFGPDSKLTQAVKDTGISSMRLNPSSLSLQGFGESPDNVILTAFK